MNDLHAWWTTRSAREQRSLGWAGAIVTLAALWWLAIAPALATLRGMQARHAQADTQLQSMQTLAAQARALQTQRSLSYDESLRNLEGAVKQTLGSAATLAVSNERATIVLKAVSAQSLALWLGQVRVNARLVPAEARLLRSTSAAGSGTSSGSGALWDGTIVVNLPSR